MTADDIKALVERLRKHRETGTCMEGTVHLAEKAADALETLTLENQRLRAETSATSERLGLLAQINHGYVDEIKALQVDAEAMRQELKNIANADTVEWDDPTQYEAWAKSRARHTLAQIDKEKP